MGTTNTHQQIAQEIAALREVAVISHMRPDGDAVGSTLGLGLALQSLGKRIHLWNADGAAPTRFDFLPGAHLITAPPADWPAHVQALICVDCGEPKRLGDSGRHLIDTAPLSINIDHHETNTLYADLNLVDGTAAACACVLMPLLDALKVDLSRPMADSLYAAVSTDTGSFQYSSTTPDVMRLAARLMGTGIDVGDINRRLYQEQPLSSFILQREVLSNMVVDFQGQVVHFSITQARKQELHLGLEDTKDLVDIIRVLRGAKIAAIFEEVDDGLIRISLRSKVPDVRVNDIASQFGGGGHPMAAGIRVRGSLQDVRSAVLQAIDAALASLP